MYIVSLAVTGMLFVLKLIGMVTGGWLVVFSPLLLAVMFWFLGIFMRGFIVYLDEWIMELERIQKAAEERKKTLEAQG